MSYKNILTVVAGDDTSIVPKAVGLAALQDGHLDVICLGVDHSHATYYAVGSNALLVQETISQAHENAESIRQVVEPLLENGQVRWSTQEVIALGNDIGRAVLSPGRFADLAVLPLPYGSERVHHDSIILETLLLDAKCPILIIPQDCDVSQAPKTVVIGWNESPEALSAIRAAMPFLKRAETVHIAIIDPPEHAADRSDPGGTLAVYLARHGVVCDIQIMSRSGARISEKIARYLGETGADLLVMGGYGHSRFREAILGGATRDMLEHAKVPVLVAH